MTEKYPLFRDTFLEINLDCIAFNLNQIRKAAPPGTCIAAVVKANAYGHGALGIAPTLMENGADLLAVATLSEALALKKRYPDFPVLILGFTPDTYLPYVVSERIIQTVDQVRQARLLSRLAANSNTTALIHIKVDTGFHRLGFPCTPDGLRQMIPLFSMPHLRVQGIFSHLALAGDEENEEQFQRFLSIVHALEQAGCRCDYHHIADSISFVDSPQYQLDLIRPGAILYGLKPFHRGHLELRQALTFQTRLCHISHIREGEGVGYDYRFRAKRDSIIGTLPFGYADGYPRSLGEKGFVTIRGQKAPLIGVICMDQCMVDLTDLPSVTLGDKAVIYGDGKDNTLDIHHAAELAGTNKNELVSRLTSRPARVYKKNGTVVEVVHDYALTPPFFRDISDCHPPKP